MSNLNIIPRKEICKQIGVSRDTLKNWIRERNFPKPFLKKPSSGITPKHKEITNILKTYPKLKFILIGDCGQHDPYIYMSLANNYPGKIMAIYLVKVNHKRKMLRVEMLYDNYKTIPVLLVANTKEAINHAKLHGFTK